MAANSKPQLPKSGEELFTLIESTSQVLTRVQEIEFYRRGLTFEQAKVIRALGIAEEGLQPAQIAKLLFREPHTISGLISRMEKLGLVSRANNLKAKNKVRVTLTKKGEKAWEKVRKSHQAISAVWEELPAESRIALGEELRNLREVSIVEFRKWYRTTGWLDSM